MNRIFFDLDGVLAEFKYASTLEDIYQEGYFRNLKPNKEMVEAAKCLHSIDEVEVFVLSAVLSDSRYALSEKNEWLDEWLPEIDPAHRIFPFCGENKTTVIEGGVSISDILVDDYGLNCADWSKEGTYIKVSRNAKDKKYERNKHENVISISDRRGDIVECILSVKENIMGYIEEKRAKEDAILMAEVMNFNPDKILREVSKKQEWTKSSKIDLSKTNIWEHEDPYDEYSLEMEV